ncbi:hypothetical protein O6H91_07G083300 [Diphasiastrum complanatum]|uniref:Uncharacterized protein n=1 Tax=Diphasiastrum complanatum TaxID=34168 RepID=A0ACC2D7E1_DIPCM|nr:hypothetical protein O6H91_07G083300 [Diphasiastrum complanatum]
MSAFLPKIGLTTAFTIWKPKEGHTADEVLEMQLKHRGNILQIKELIAFAALKSVDGTKAGGYSLLTEGAELHNVLATAPATAPLGEIQSIAELATHQFELLDSVLTEGATLEISKGQVLSVVMFTTPDAVKQAKAAYLIGEYLKTAFQGMSGVKAGSLLKSVDGTKIAVLGYWESLQIVLAQKDHQDEWASLTTHLADVVIGFEKELLIVVELITA